MNNFNYYSPTEFVFGKGRAAEAGYYVKKYGGSKVLIHYGGGSAVRSGLIDTVKKSLDDAGVQFCELGGVKPNPRDTLVYKSGKYICLTCSGGSAFIFSQLLHSFPSIKVNNRFVSVFKNHMLTFGIINLLFDLFDYLRVLKFTVWPIYSFFIRIAPIV